MKKRFFALFMSLVMVFSLTVSAYAEAAVLEGVTQAPTPSGVIAEQEKEISQVPEELLPSVEPEETPAPEETTEPEATPAQPEEPAETPEEPTETPEEPTETPEEPTETPEEPTETPEVPAETPEEPAETPEVPAETPEEPTETPEVPAETPEVPAETPEVPAETPEVPVEPEVPVVGCTECLQTEGHAETCSQYVAPVVACEVCGLTEGHAEDCITQIVCEICGETGAHFTDDCTECPACFEVEGAAHLEGCEFAPVVLVDPVDAVVYVEDNGVYSEISAPIDVEEYDGQTVYVVANGIPQNIYFERIYEAVGGVLGTYGANYSIDDPEYAMLSVSGEASGSTYHYATVTLVKDAPAETEIVLYAKTLLGSEYVVTIVVLDVPSVDEIEPGDAGQIEFVLSAKQNELKQLESERENLTDAEIEARCDAFFEEMLGIYSKAFQNNYPLVDTEEMMEIDAQFDALEEKLLEDFGYNGFGYSAAPSVARFSLRTASEPAEFAEEGDGVKVNKKVNETVSGEDSDFMLTLEAYVTGEVSEIEITTPSDIVMVLDQSGSMYAPMGAEKSYYNNTKADADLVEKNSDLIRISLEDLEDEKASHLGYYIAHSTILSHKDCKCGGDGEVVIGGTEQDCEEGTYDWFVIHYDADSTDIDGDSDKTEKLWKLYRIPYTSCPINDSDAWSGNYNLPDMTPVAGNLAADSLESLGINAYTVYQTQYGALYDAIAAFVDSMSDVHRVAVVGFASSLGYANGDPYTDGSQAGHGGTGIYVGGTFYPAYNNANQYDAAALSNYSSALTSGKTAIMKNVDAVKTDFYGTNHDLGMDLANKVLANAPDYIDGNGNKKETNKVIILFTDGVPSPQDGADVADNTIAQANSAKGSGATVYSIWTSTLTGANSYDFLEKASSNYDSDGNVKYKEDGTTPEDKYAIKVDSADGLKAAFEAAMQDTSSATMELPETTILKDVLTQYFILPDELTEQVEELLAHYKTQDDYKDKSEEEIQCLPEVQTKLKDYIKVYTADFTGNYTEDAEGKLVREFTNKTAFNANITIEKDENGVYRKINVTNFDYSANFVADVPRAETEGGEENFYGRELIVEIPINPNPDFVGGDEVVTNTGESGIYTGDGNAVETFPIPDVAIDVLKITPEFQSQDIYISQTANLSTILNLGVFKVEEVTENEEVVYTPYIVDGINNAYADIVYTIIDPDGFTLTYTIPAGTAFGELSNLGWSYHEDVGGIAPLLKEDTTYKATCEVISINNKDENLTKAESEQTVRVFKPEITFNDSTINLGEVANYSKNGPSVAWKWYTTDNEGKTVTYTAVATQEEASDVENPVILGTAPELVYTYDPEAAAFTQDTPVKVTVTAQKNGTNIPVDQEITEYVTFYRDACGFIRCTHKEKAVVTDAAPNFVVHINTFDLLIEKTGANETLDPGQTFVFRITGPDNFSMDVVIEGNGFVKVVSLPVGETNYKVTELTDWSWRYEVEDNAVEVTVELETAKDGTVTVSFKNVRCEKQWLDGNSYCANLFTETTIESKKSKEDEN